MKRFTVSVGGITRREYFEACTENERRMHLILGVAMVIICGAILLIKGTVDWRDIAGPAAVYIVVMGGYGLMTRLGYKNQLAVLDPPVVYDIHGGRWAVTKDGATVEVEWKATTRLRKTRSCLFLYSDGATSNLIPLRLLTEEQVAAMETWFRNTRSMAKDYQKKKEKLEREKFRAEHPGLRLGRTGPVWGPWKRK